MKRVFLGLLLVLILTTGRIVSYGVISIPSDWTKDTVDSIQAESILKEDFFRNYQRNITRKDFAYLGVRLYEELTNRKTFVEDAKFNDTRDEYVLKAKNMGFISGVGNNNFDPNKAITREELATLLIKLLDSTGINYIKDTDIENFSDSRSISNWAKEYVKMAKANDIMNGVGDNKFKPKDTVSREVALIIFDKTLDKFEHIIEEKMAMHEKRKNKELFWDWKVIYDDGLLNKKLNSHRFPNWSIATNDYYDFYEYNPLPIASMYASGAMKLDYTEEDKNRNDYTDMLNAFHIFVPIFEVYSDVSVAKGNISKTVPLVTKYDWDKGYEVATQKNAYPNLKREHYDMLVEDFKTLLNSDREETSMGFYIFGLINGKYYNAYYDLGDGLGAYIESSNSLAKIGILLRDADYQTMNGTFLEVVKDAKNNPNLKYVDLR